MGLRSPSNKIYLKVSYGMIRKKCEATAEGAVERKTKDGEKSYALEYRSLTGTLDEVSFRDDEDYGKSWSLDIVDEKLIAYSLQIQEDSRYGMDLLKKLPNLHQGDLLEITPYDFTKDSKRHCGLSIKRGEEKISSYYQEFLETPEGKMKINNLHGFPDFTGDRKDKDEFRIYMIQTAKFLRTQGLRHLETEFKHRREQEEIKPPFSSEDSPITDDDVPF